MMTMSHYDCYLARRDNVRKIDVRLLLRFYMRCTRRQQQVIQLASDGLSNSEIGYMLEIASCSVGGYLTAIYRALGELELFQDMPINRYLLVLLFTRFFEQYPDLHEPYGQVVSSSASADNRRSRRLNASSSSP